MDKNIFLKNGEIKFTTESIETFSKYSGYNITTAVLELLDNAFGACSKKINIYLQKYLQDNALIIEDYGCGMTEKDIEENLMKCGESNNKYDKNSTGRYGLGFKFSSLYLRKGKEIIVISQIANGDVVEMRWDGEMKYQIYKRENNYLGHQGTKIIIVEHIVTKDVKSL